MSTEPRNISRGGPQLSLNISHQCVRPHRRQISLGHNSPPSHGPAFTPPISLPYAPSRTAHPRTRLVHKSNSIHTSQPLSSPFSDQKRSPSPILSFAPPPNDEFTQSPASSSTLSSPRTEPAPPTLHGQNSTVILPPQ